MRRVALFRALRLTLAGGLLASPIFLSVGDVSASVNPSELACADLNPSLTEYTFDMDVAMSMRHFPWLRFHLDGSGRYVRGESEAVDFTRVPFFARGFSQIDLSPLDPCMWPHLYTVRALGAGDGTIAFSLRPKKVDPNDQNPLVEAVVTLDSAYDTREVVLHYENGSITLALTPASILGYRLPASGEADIDMPGRSLTARADFTNYAIVNPSDETSPSATHRFK